MIVKQKAQTSYTVDVTLRGKIGVDDAATTQAAFVTLLNGFEDILDHDVQLLEGDGKDDHMSLCAVIQTTLSIAELRERLHGWDHEETVDEITVIVTPPSVKAAASSSSSSAPKPRSRKEHPPPKEGERRPVLMSLRQQWTDAILNGEKTVELRRKRSGCYDGAPVIIYSTNPVMQVEGTARVSNVIADTPDVVWALTCDYNGDTREEFDEYFQGCEIAYGIVLEDPVRLAEPFALPGGRGPQSFQYLFDDEPADAWTLKKAGVGTVSRLSVDEVRSVVQSNAARIAALGEWPPYISPDSLLERIPTGKEFGPGFDAGVACATRLIPEDKQQLSAQLHAAYTQAAVNRVRLEAASMHPDSETTWWLAACSVCEEGTIDERAFTEQLRTFERLSVDPTARAAAAANELQQMKQSFAVNEYGIAHATVDGGMQGAYICGHDISSMYAAEAGLFFVGTILPDLGLDNFQWSQPANPNGETQEERMGRSGGVHGSKQFVKCADIDEYGRVVTHLKENGWLPS